MLLALSVRRRFTLAALYLILNADDDIDAETPPGPYFNFATLGERFRGHCECHHGRTAFSFSPHAMSRGIMRKP